MRSLAPSSRIAPRRCRYTMSAMKIAANEVRPEPLRIAEDATAQRADEHYSISSCYADRSTPTFP
jgi:hypothetical protein